MDFSPDLLVLCCKQDIKDGGDGELMSPCAGACALGEAEGKRLCVCSLNLLCPSLQDHTTSSEEALRSLQDADDTHFHTSTND